MKRAWPWILGFAGVALATIAARALGVHVLWQDPLLVAIDVGGVIIGFRDAFDPESPFNRKDAYWIFGSAGMSLLDLSLGLVLTFFAWQPYIVFNVVKWHRRRTGA